MMNSEREKPKPIKSQYQSWCMSCISVHHPLMLTGYCLSSQFDGVVMRCDNCGRGADLAMVKVRPADEGAE